jgi:hypothetical protein
MAALFRTSVLTLGSVLLCAPLVGCGVGPLLTVADNNSPSVAVRATFRPQNLSRTPGRSDGGFELGYERFEAHSTQTLEASLPAVVNGQIINPPDTLHNSATVQTAHIAYSHRFSMGSQFQLEPFVGLSALSTEFRVQPSSPAPAATARYNHSAVLVGVTPRWRFNDQWAVEARVAAVRFDAIDSLTSLDLPGLFIALG